MLYAVDDSGNKSLPTREGEFYCPCCLAKVQAKMGFVKIHHWAHVSTEIYCDSRPMSAWHLEWQSLFPKENVEVYVNRKRRADVMLDDGLIIEFQNSPITQEEIEKRSAQANDGIVWVHNMIKQNQNEQFVRKNQNGENLYTAYWKFPISGFDRQRVRGEEIWFQFSENSLGKICWVDYCSEPYATFAFYLYNKKQFIDNLLDTKQYANN